MDTEREPRRGQEVKQMPTGETNVGGIPAEDAPIAHPDRWTQRESLAEDRRSSRCRRGKPTLAVSLRRTPRSPTRTDGHRERASPRTGGQADADDSASHPPRPCAILQRTVIFNADREARSREKVR